MRIQNRLKYTPRTLALALSIVGVCTAQTLTTINLGRV